MDSDIESEYDIDPMFSSSGESMADIANDVTHKLYTSEGETVVDVLSDIRKALHHLNKILYNKLPNPPPAK